MNDWNTVQVISVVWMNKFWSLAYLKSGDLIRKSAVFLFGVRIKCKIIWKRENTLESFVIAPHQM